MQSNVACPITARLHIQSERHLWLRGALQSLARAFMGSQTQAFSTKEGYILVATGGGWHAGAHKQRAL